MFFNTIIVYLFILDKVGRPFGSFSKYNFSCRHIEQQLVAIQAKNDSCRRAIEQIQ